MQEALPHEVNDRLAKERNIWIVTVRGDGRPHMVPVWFVWFESKIYVCIEPESVKGRNILLNRNVTLALEDGSHPVICEGHAGVVEKPWPAPVARMFDEKYDWDILADLRYTRLVEITPRRWLHW